MVPALILVKTFVVNTPRNSGATKEIDLRSIERFFTTAPVSISEINAKTFASEISEFPSVFISILPTIDVKAILSSRKFEKLLLNNRQFGLTESNCCGSGREHTVIHTPLASTLLPDTETTNIASVSTNRFTCNALFRKTTRQDFWLNKQRGEWRLWVDSHRRPSVGKPTFVAVPPRCPGADTANDRTGWRTASAYPPETCDVG